MEIKNSGCILFSEPITRMIEILKEETQELKDFTGKQVDQITMQEFIDYLITKHPEEFYLY